MLKNILNRTANAVGFNAVRATNALIGNGRDTKGILNEMRLAYHAGKVGIVYAKPEKTPVDLDDEVQAFVLTNDMIRRELNR